MGDTKNKTTFGYTKGLFLRGSLTLTEFIQKRVFKELLCLALLLANFHVLYSSSCVSS